MKRSYFARTALSGALFLALIGGATASRADDTGLLDRIQALEATIQALQSELVTVKAEAAKASAKPAADQSAVKTEFKPSPSFTSPDGSSSFKLRGRIEADYATHSHREGPARFADGTELRRARIGVEGTLYTDWGYRLEADFGKASRSDRDGQEVDVKDAYIQYRGLTNTRITVGQHKTPNSLERLTGSPQLLFLERAAPVNAFTDRSTAGGDFKAGISAGYTGTNWTATLGVYGENFAVASTGPSDEGWGVNGRVTFAPIAEDGKILHLGASAYWRQPGALGVVRFRDRPEIAVDSTAPRLVDTGAISADDYYLLAGEVGAVWGPVTVQAEYLRSEVARRDSAAPDVTFDGGYVAMSYFLTGETRPYADGLFGRVAPRQNFSLKNGGWGAFELAARFSTLDLNDNDILGGKQENITVGLNWYLNPYMRTSFNWVRFDADRQGIENKGDILAARIAVNW